MLKKLFKDLRNLLHLEEVGLHLEVGTLVLLVVMVVVQVMEG